VKVGDDDVGQQRLDLDGGSMSARDGMARSALLLDQYS